MWRRYRLPLTRKSTRITPLMLVMPLCAICGGCLTWAYQAGIHGENVKFLRTQQARVKVSGVAEDENGNPLCAVSVRVVRTYESPSWEGFPGGDQRRSEGRETVNGKFSFEWDVAQTVRLTFEKAGYRSVALTFEVHKTVDRRTSAVESPPAEPIIRNGLVVVLKAE